MHEKRDDGSILTMGFTPPQDSPYAKKINNLQPETKAAVRGNVPVAGWLLQPVPGEPNSTRAFLVSEIDLKGSIPKSIYGMVYKE
jgi:hypothetical protein